MADVEPRNPQPLSLETLAIQVQTDRQQVNERLTEMNGVKSSLLQDDAGSLLNNW